ncbi:prephenate dehydrogenase dimerization domain-containing protein [Campylobacter pinnipediorum]|nr:prephenate dehydrogenase dimerization domain-containing protein [Campylobacter pinnipediorum]
MNAKDHDHHVAITSHLTHAIFFWLIVF